MASDHQRLFCFGLGYSAKALAALLRAQGWQVAGTCRDENTRSALQDLGYSAWIMAPDRLLADLSGLLADATHVLCSVPPGVDGDPVLRQAAGALTAATHLRWVGYLSTTGVYGDHDGDWVDEDTPLAPTSDRSRWRAAAEDAWLELWQKSGLPVHVFRLAGIYGPGRSQLDSLKRGQARRIDKPGQVFSRIHVDDIARVLKASIDRPRPGRIYNVCDDEAAPPAEVVEFAADLLGLPPPPLLPFDTAELSPMAQSFYRDNKRVRNRRLHDELGVSLRYPSYREGLRALMEADR